MGIIFLNVLVLDYFVFFGKPKQIVQNINLGNSAPSAVAATTTPASNQVTQSTPQYITQTIDACPNTCLTAIKTATASFKPTQNVVSNTSTAQQSSSGSNEYFVPFGSATSTSQGTYTSIGGLQAYVNMSQYKNVQTVVFEVSIAASGIASVQLYDATDGYVIASSQVSTPGGNPQFLISSPLTLPAGNKLYQVQIQTQLSSPATINSARLHITLH